MHNVSEGGGESGQVHSTAPAPLLQIESFGQVAYGRMLALQEARHAAVAAGESPDTLFLLEHKPVITTGKNTGAGHVLLTPSVLEARGIDYFETGRGGDVTYHAPGQLVGYPIVALQESERDVRRFVWRLEEIIIRTAADFGVKAERVEGLRGIWVGNDKLAAVGVRIARWVTMHGFALNVSTDLQGFKSIIPCGLHNKGVTSLEVLCHGVAPPRAEVESRIVAHASVILERGARHTVASPLPEDAGDQERSLQ